VTRIITNSTKPDNLNDIFSEFCAANDFGVISPNIRINKVIIPVATPTPVLPNASMAKDVIKDDAPILTTLLPISMALNSLLGSLSNLFILFAPFSLFSTICLTRILLKDIKAVSEAENKAENIKHTINIAIFHQLSEFKNHHTPNVII
ncbi:MAG: hypothetical protein WC151_12555, partial [Bacteroidales bacterium]